MELFVTTKKIEEKTYWRGWKYITLPRLFSGERVFVFHFAPSLGEEYGEEGEHPQIFIIVDSNASISSIEEEVRLIDEELKGKVPIGSLELLRGKNGSLFRHTWQKDRRGKQRVVFLAKMKQERARIYVTKNVAVVIAYQPPPSPFLFRKREKKIGLILSEPSASSHT